MFGYMIAVALATLTASPAATTKVHEFALDTALRCVCQSHPDQEQCREERREDVTESVLILTTLAEEYQLPEYARPVLVATACGESGITERPTCGADEACVDTCLSERGWTHSLTPKRLRVCSVRCGGSKRCNDRGTSAGPFQIKWNGPLGKMARRQGVDLFDMEQAGRFYLNQLLDAVRTERGADVARRLRGDCGTMPREKRWRVALYRLGRGPTVQHSSTRTVVDLRTGEMREVTTPRIPRCSGSSRYGQWAAKWARGNPEAWLPVHAIASN